MLFSTSHPWLLKRVLPPTTTITPQDWSLIAPVAGVLLLKAVSWFPSWDLPSKGPRGRIAYIQWLIQGWFSMWDIFEGPTQLQRSCFGARELVDKNQWKFYFLLLLCSWAWVSFLHIDVKTFLHFRAEILLWRIWPIRGLGWSDSMGTEIEVGVWAEESHSRRWTSWLLTRLLGNGVVFWAVESCTPPLCGRNLEGMTGTMVLGKSEGQETSGKGVYFSRAHSIQMIPFQQFVRRYVDIAFVKNIIKKQTLVQCVSNSTLHHRNYLITWIVC